MKMMQSPHNLHPVLEIILSVSLFASSAVLGFLHNADLVLGLIAKLTAIAAGASTVTLAYLNYRKNFKK